MLVRRLGLFLGSSFAMWLLVAIPARLLGGDIALLHSGSALLLCLVPTSLTLIWSHATLQSQPEQQLAAILGGTVARILFAIAGALTLYHATELYHERSFLFWVIGAYLLTLGLEVGLLVAGSSASGRLPSASGHSPGGGQA